MIKIIGKYDKKKFKKMIYMRSFIKNTRRSSK